MNGEIPNCVPNFSPAPNMAMPPRPPSPWNPNLPPPNFSVPPPNMHLPPPPSAVQQGAFPRFSGPINNQPTFTPMGNLPPTPSPRMHLNAPSTHSPTNFNNVVNQNNRRGQGRGAGRHSSRSPRFNNNNRGGRGGGVGLRGPRSNPNGSSLQSSPSCSNPNQNQNQRQVGFVPDDIFNDAPKEVRCGFPYFNPSQPPPPMMNRSMSMNSVSMNPAVTSVNPQAFPPPPPSQNQSQMSGMGMRGGFHPSNNGFPNNHNNNNNHGNYNINNNNNRGGFQRGERGHNNNYNRGGRGGNHNHNAGNDGFQKKKKEKIDKRDLPENNAFYCDTCDRGFKSEEKYIEHVAQHQQCKYKDCPFVAAPKLVQLHMNMQHRGGLAKRIYGLETAEDVKKWREERKRKFPTAENIKKKKEKMEEMIARGEVIETKDFGKMTNGRNRGRGRDRGRGRGRGRFRRGRRYDDAIDVDNDDNEDDDDGPPEEMKIERSRDQCEEEGEQIDLTNAPEKTESVKPTDQIDLTSTTDSEEQESHSKPEDNGTKPEHSEKKAASAGSTKSKSSPKKKESGTNAKGAGLSLLSGYGSSSSSLSEAESDDDSDEESQDEESNGKANPKPFKQAEHIIFTDSTDDDNADCEENDNNHNGNGDRFGLIPGESNTVTPSSTSPSSCKSPQHEKLSLSSPPPSSTTKLSSKSSPCKKSPDSTKQTVHSNGKQNGQSFEPAVTNGNTAGKGDISGDGDNGQHTDFNHSFSADRMPKQTGKGTLENRKVNESISSTLSSSLSSSSLPSSSSLSSSTCTKPAENGKQSSADDDQDSDKPEEVPIKRDNSDSGESKVKAAVPEVKGVKRGHQAKGGGPPDKRSKFTPRQPKKSYTLLEKLLSKEIRRERNKILQCVHFMVKNKFFDGNDGH